MLNDKTIEFQQIKFSYLHYYFKVNAVEVEALPFERALCKRQLQTAIMYGSIVLYKMHLISEIWEM